MTSALAVHTVLPSFRVASMAAQTRSAASGTASAQAAFAMRWWVGKSCKMEVTRFPVFKSRFWNDPRIPANWRLLGLKKMTG